MFNILKNSKQMRFYFEIVLQKLRISVEGYFLIKQWTYQSDIDKLENYLHCICLLSTISGLCRQTESMHLKQCQREGLMARDRWKTITLNTLKVHLFII